LSSELLIAISTIWVCFEVFFTCKVLPSILPETNFPKLISWESSFMSLFMSRGSGTGAETYRVKEEMLLFNSDFYCSKVNLPSVLPLSCRFWTRFSLSLLESYLVCSLGWRVYFFNSLFILLSMLATWSLWAWRASASSFRFFSAASLSSLCTCNLEAWSS